jgi:hypothetical protein
MREGDGEGCLMKREGRDEEKVNDDDGGSRGKGVKCKRERRRGRQ